MTEDLQYNQIPIDFGFYTKKTFDNFIIGNNEDLYNSLLNLNKSNHLILIYGNRSSGKTHLCEAVTQSVKSDVIRVNPDTKLQSASLSDFYDLAIIDDVDKLLENSTNEEIR